jgi:hypothetical protein
MTFLYTSALIHWTCLFLILSFEAILSEKLKVLVMMIMLIMMIMMTMIIIICIAASMFCVVINECCCNRGVYGMVNCEELIGTAEI